MSRVLTFSRTYPAYHPNRGKPTYFVERIWNSLTIDYDYKVPVMAALGIIHVPFLEPKHHTIRAGKHWRVGDKFSPRVWSDKPYRSKQITIAPDIELLKVWDFEMDICGVYSINGKYLLDEVKENKLAQNDGLTRLDMFYWFMPNYDKPTEFSGQILCWSENVKY